MASHLEAPKGASTDALIAPVQPDTRHTPGPWRMARDLGVPYGWFIYSEYGRGHSPTIEYIAHNVAHKPNAALIAAAPELLALAQEFVADFAPNTAELAGWRTHFRAVLAKLEG